MTTGRLEHHLGAVDVGMQAIHGLVAGGAAEAGGQVEQDIRPGDDGVDGIGFADVGHYQIEVWIVDQVGDIGPAATT